MSVKNSRERGRPNKFDSDLVSDIAEQRLIAFYNEWQDILRDRVKHDPLFPSKIRSRAHALEATARAWLQVLDDVDSSRPDFTIEAAFRFWCLRLEPPYPPDVLAEKPDKEQELRAIYIRHCTPEHWRVNCKPWVDAINRVRQDKLMTLNVPQRPVIEEEENDDDYL